jgi:dipeptidase
MGKKRTQQKSRANVQNQEREQKSQRVDACRFGMPQNMLQQTLLPPQHPAYGLMHLAGNLNDDNHSCAAAHAMVSAIEIATSHEERQSFALHLMCNLRVFLSECIVTNICDTPP